MVTNPSIPNFFSYHKINLLKKYIHCQRRLRIRFTFEKMIFENSTDVIKTYFNTSVTVNARETIIPPYW